MADPNIVTLTEQNFDAEVLKSQLPVLVDFWAEWCGPCKMIAPVLDELATDLEGQLRIGKVNIDEQQPLALKHDIRAIPTLLVFKDGQVVEQMMGAKSKRAIREQLDRYLV